MTTAQENHAEQQAKSQLEGVVELIDSLNAARESNDGYSTFDGDRLSTEDIEQRIQEDPLSVLVRSGWHYPGADDMTSAKYEILLCTGGPAVRIIGELSDHSEPTSARLQYQDWGTPWTEFFQSSDVRDKLLEYVNSFYFGE